MSTIPQNFVITPVASKVDIAQGRAYVNAEITKRVTTNPDYIIESSDDLLGDLDIHDQLLYRYGIWAFLDNIERLYSTNPAITEPDDVGSQLEVTTQSTGLALVPNNFGLPIWQITYGKFDSYTANWIANAKYFAQEFPALLSTIGIRIWGDKHYGNPSFQIQ